MGGSNGALVNPTGRRAWTWTRGIRRSFGGEVGGRYGFGHPPDHADYFRQEWETTGENYNYGLSAAGPEAPDPRLYGDGYDITVDSGNPQQQQQHQRQQDSTPPATSTSTTLSSPAPGAAPASITPLQLFIARDVQLGKSECGDTVAVDSEVLCVVALWAVLILERLPVLQAHFGVPRGNLDRTVARSGTLIRERVQ